MTTLIRRWGTPDEVLDEWGHTGTSLSDAKMAFGPELAALASLRVQVREHRLSAPMLTAYELCIWIAGRPYAHTTHASGGRLALAGMHRDLEAVLQAVGRIAAGNYGKFVDDCWTLLRLAPPLAAPVMEHLVGSPVVGPVPGRSFCAPSELLSDPDFEDLLILARGTDAARVIATWIPAWRFRAVWLYVARYSRLRAGRLLTDASSEQLATLSREDLVTLLADRDAESRVAAIRALGHVQGTS